MKVDTGKLRRANPYPFSYIGVTILAIDNQFIMKMRKLIWISLALLCMASCHKNPKPTPAPTPTDDKIPVHKEGEPYDTYRGLVMAGYQGWFGTPDDGSMLTKKANTGWYHYRESEQFRPGVRRNSIDFWPDMREYEKKYVVGEEKSNANSSPFIMPDGSHATLFSSYDESTVMLHFKWMKDYGIDGVWMQRFLSELGGPNNKAHFDMVLQHAMKASNLYERAIAVMYDMSGFTTTSSLRAIVSDARNLMQKYTLTDRTKQKFYLHENGKPMIALWGIGFNDNSHPRPTAVEEIINLLKAQGWSVFLGVPTYWRDGGGDCVSGEEHAKLLELLNSSDGFFPWYTGRYDCTSYRSSGWQAHIQADIKAGKKMSTEDHTVAYAVHAFPGFSWRNMDPNYNLKTNDGTGDRDGGKFFWNQLYWAMKYGAESFYIGMFDEIDEGTAIFKLLNVKDVPSNVPYKVGNVPTSYDYVSDDDYWVTYKTNGSYTMSDSQNTGGDVRWSKKASELNVRFQGIDNDKDTDWYLFLTGEAGKMLRGEKPMSAMLP